MCIQSIVAKKYLRDYEPDFSKLKGFFPPDIYFITKEKLSLSAHKVVLARDTFWKQLIQSMSGAAGVCPSEPLTIFLPDFDYKTVKLMLKMYYNETVGLNKDEHESFLQLIRSFNPNIGLFNGKCRICNKEVRQQNIIDHVINHIKQSAYKDINNENVVTRCSFTSPRTCTIESDRKTVANGIFNNARDEDMEEIIKEHYRRHLRDEMFYLRRTCGPNMCLESDDELYNLADINAASTDLPDDFLQGVSMAAGHLQLTDYAPVVENDDYSGGITSPEPIGGDSGDSGSETSPDLQTSRDNLMKEVKTNISTDYVDEDINQKSGGSRRSSMELEEDQTQIWACIHCSADKIKSIGGFRKHFVYKHVFKELEKMIIDSEDVDLDSLKCTKCKKPEERDKVWQNMKMYVPHTALVHNALDDFLLKKGETIEDHYNQGYGKARHLSGASHSDTPRSGASPAKSRKSGEDIVDTADTDSDDCDADAIWGESFGKKNELTEAFNSEEEGEKGSKIVISNLQHRVTYDDIVDLFGDVGALRKVRVAIPGQAEVTFVNHDDAEKAVEIYHNRKLDGKPMKCTLTTTSSDAMKNTFKLPAEMERTVVNKEDEEGMEDEHNDDSEDEKETLPPGPEDNHNMDVD